MASMMERRVKRSVERTEALQFLVESVADRTGVRALALVDDNGRIVAGLGMPMELVGLARTARDVAWRRASVAEVEAAAPDQDVTARTVATPDGLLYFAAIGCGVPGVGDAVRAVQRILVEC